jgi:hypothetical protein
MSFEERLFLYTTIMQIKSSTKVKTTFLYRASVDGWNSTNFHPKCDLKGPTITFFKVKDTNLRCGGFTSLNWNAANSGNVNDPTAFLFSLDQKKYYQSQGLKGIIRQGGGYGPCFGSSTSDELLVKGSIFMTACRSNPNRPYYSVPADPSGNSVLTGKKGSFTPDEIECFQVLLE